MSYKICKEYDNCEEGCPFYFRYLKTDDLCILQAMIDFIESKIEKELE